MSVENDIARAWRTVWDTIPNINTLVPGKLRTDEIEQGQSQTSEPRTPTPYAILSIELQRKYFRYGSWDNWHRVTVEIYDANTKAEMGTIISLIQNAFDWEKTAPHKLRFPWNANLYHRHTVIDEEKEEPGTVKVRGHHQRQARLAFIVSTTATRN